MSWEEPTYIPYYDQTEADYSTFDRKITLRFAYELQNHQHTNLPIFYIAFDILHFGKRVLLDEPLEERKKRLAEIAERDTPT